MGKTDGFMPFPRHTEKWKKTFALLRFIFTHLQALCDTRSDFSNRVELG